MDPLIFAYLSGELLFAGMIAGDGWYLFWGITFLFFWRIADKIATSPIPDYSQPRCPACQSRNYVVKCSGLQNSVDDSIVRWFLSTYRLRYKKTCLNCGHTWTDANR